MMRTLALGATLYNFDIALADSDRHRATVGCAPELKAQH